MSTKEDIIVIRAYEDPIHLPTPEVRQSTGVELIEVTVDPTNGNANRNANGYSVSPGDINSHILSDKSIQTSVKPSISESIPLPSNESNANPVVINKSKSSLGVSNPTSIPSNKPEPKSASTITIPRGRITTSNSFNDYNVSAIIGLVYIIACIISSFIYGTPFNKRNSSIRVIYIFTGALGYFFISMIFWKRIIRSISFSITCFVITTILLYVYKIYVKDEGTLIGVLIISLYTAAPVCIILFPPSTTTNNQHRTYRSSYQRPRPQPPRSHHF